MFAMDDFDQKVSGWATKHNPIFGAEDAARDASISLRDVLEAEWLLTAFIHDAFLGLPEDKRFGFVILPLKGGATTGFFFAF